jgi:hypothetical protein
MITNYKADHGDDKEITSVSVRTNPLDCQRLENPQGVKRTGPNVGREDDVLIK